jgi:nucleoside-diphosphate-sugar epimerase
MNIALTGSSGFIGLHLIDALLSEGHTLFLFVRQQTSLNKIPKSSSIHLRYIDFNDQETLKKALNNEMDIVIHCAGLIQGFFYKDYYKGNTLSTDNLIKASLTQKTLPYFIFISSASACGPSKSLEDLKNSDSPLTPVSFYGKSKKIAEELLQKSSLTYCIIRPVAVYGVGDTHFLPLFKLAQKRIALYLGKKSHIIDLIHISDLVQIIKAVIQKKPSNKTYIAGDGIHYTQEDILTNTLISLEKKKSKWRFCLQMPNFLVKITGNISSYFLILFHKVPFFNKDKAKEAVQKCWGFDVSKTHKELFKPHSNIMVNLKELKKDYQEKNLL